MEYGAAVWDPHQKYNSNKVERVHRNVVLQGSSKVSFQDTLVFLICLMCWGGHLFSKETGGSTYSVLLNFNGLAQVPFKGVLVEASIICPRLMESNAFE